MKYKTLLLEIFPIYLLIINVFSFLLFFIDKRRAKNHFFRIPESSLFFISFLGGSLGSFLGMRVFKHKTKKHKFLILIPILLVFNLLFLAYIISFFAK